MARKILLADDSVTAQNMGRKILADAGYEVITVNNGSAALKKIAEHKPDLIVLDVYMPGYSGLEVCQRLKESNETARIPVLLTVGKLEPFKPEEAKRTRADGFIVKPFEASELLSALSKLEDKIVPRSENSKPGRFARVSAALDEGKYDKTVAIDDDSGWRDRIAFPSKKKKKDPEEEADDSSIYNPVNKDLRTVVDHKPAVQSHEKHVAKAEEAKVDLGALAPEGLPNNVTPEEIAALAAAAAQVKGKIADARFADEKIAASSTSENKSGTENENKIAESAPVATPMEAKVEQKPVEVPAEELATKVPEANFAEQKAEPQAEEKPVEAKQEKQEGQEKKETKEAKSEEESKSLNVATPTSADVMAAISGLESVAASSGNGSASFAPAAADEPVTMAAAAGAGSAGTSSRWTAVAVALAPEEAALSLEQEMQKAYAAFAAAEAGHAAVAEAQPASFEPIGQVAPAESTFTQVSAPEPVTVPASLAPEAAQPIAEVAQAATDAITDAVKELEAVAASYEPQPRSAPAAPETSTSEISTQKSEAPHEAGTAVSASSDALSGSVAAQLESAKPEEPPFAQESKNEQAEDLKAETPKVEEPKAEAPKVEEFGVEAAKTEEFKIDAPAIATSQAEEITFRETTAQETTTQETKIDATRPEVPAAEVPAAVAATDPESASAQVHPKAPGEHGEPDVAATTAAAWASWRRVRESGKTHGSPAHNSTDSNADSKEEAARAVAAGAEKSPEDTAADPDTEVASIVDSVLADLRPKIYEEISRKIGKKK